MLVAVVTSVVNVKFYFEGIARVVCGPHDEGHVRAEIGRNKSPVLLYAVGYEVHIAEPFSRELGVGHMLGKGANSAIDIISGSVS
jgi:hypothetical protein